MPDFIPTPAIAFLVFNAPRSDFKIPEMQTNRHNSIIKGLKRCVNKHNKTNGNAKIIAKYRVIDDDPALFFIHVAVVGDARVIIDEWERKHGKHRVCVALVGDIGKFYGAFHGLRVKKDLYVENYARWISRENGFSTGKPPVV
ncbi:MAG: hypothetical protein FWG05_02475 [Kiritimatiellaeota bacterium]|nr:hypothetical protein [Kiritimatiellota bacterium]